MAKKTRPSKAQRAAALEIIREGETTHVRLYSKQSNKGWQDTPLFAQAARERQQQLFN